MTNTGTLNAWSPPRQQATFRQLLEAFSYPGRVARIDGGENSALVAVLASLLDVGSTLADPDRQLDPELLSLFEATALPAQQAAFVVARGSQPPAFVPALGTLGSPEHGATVVLRVERIGQGDPLLLSGQGCDGDVALLVRGLHPSWLAARAGWNAGFPMGVDMLLVDAKRIAALPRTTVVGSNAQTEGAAWDM